MDISWTLPSLTDAWGVFWLFAIPIGGGIPAGVLLAKSKGIDMASMSFLYFLSDIVLACVFEPAMFLFLNVARRSPKLSHAIDEVKKQMDKTLPKYGVRPGRFTLIMISFGVDPMTGRSVAKAAGHGFVSGWLLAIAGDMIYFLIIMVSTIWLGNLLGDGTLTTLIIMAVMLLAPTVFRRVRKLRSDKTQTGTS